MILLASALALCSRPAVFEAYGRVLPTAGEVFADAPRDNRAEVLKPPVTAALVDRREGATLREKLAQLPSSDWVAETLRRIEEEAEATKRPRPAAPRRSRGGFRNGVSFAMLNGLEVGYHAPGVDDQLERLRRLGADSVSLMPFAGQSSPNEPQLGYYNASPSSETDVGMVHAARRARARGFQVLWKPHVWVSHSSWPGEIEMSSEEDWAAWWSQYRRYVLRHAVLAEWTGTELFSVGVELVKTVGREAEWRHLIRSVRRIFTGEVTYAGNWWGDYDRVGFWDELDYVGVDAYFPLAYEADADREALEAGARRVVGELRRAAERFGKPVLLTEVGFAARKRPGGLPLPRARGRGGGAELLRGRGGFGRGDGRLVQRRGSPSSVGRVRHVRRVRRVRHNLPRQHHRPDSHFRESIRNPETAGVRRALLGARSPRSQGHSTWHADCKAPLPGPDVAG